MKLLLAHIPCHMEDCRSSRPGEVRASLADFLTRYPWEVFLTVSPDRSSSLKALRRQVLRFLRYLDSQTSEPLFAFFALEHAPGVKEGWHAHLLLLGVAGLEVRGIEAIAVRFFGMANAKTYDPSLSGVYYVTKAFFQETNGEVLWDFFGDPKTVT